MSPHFVGSWIVSLVFIATLGLGHASHERAPARVSLDLTTLHAAALSKARGPADSTDAPYLLLSVVGSTGRTETRTIPAAGHWSLALDGAIGVTPITTFDLEPGDSIRVLLNVLEDRATSPQELEIATAATRMTAERRTFSNAPAAGALSAALAPLVTRGAHWLGTVSLLLTNDGGTTNWTRLDCVSSCSISRSPIGTGGQVAMLESTSTRAVTGVVELSGASATYHLQVGLRRMP
jgi:hypothetical protein